MKNLSELPFVSVKKKNIQLLLDYCVENKIEFTVSPKADDFHVHFNLQDYNTAIALGMCLREMKIELPSGGFTSVATLKNNKKASNGSKDLYEESASFSEPVSFSENSLKFDLDTVN